ncbi:nucleotide exchange factor GrpE [Virgibacillus siamensis]|uniref:nucleotide exchange factor GrpE n=1 Tax=Virgibacillus siamensis TaxID=480071 RepID=UPI0009851F76|nr:nucleotide exchange factor GrpE [Virgibacillus siamensis]
MDENKEKMVDSNDAAETEATETAEATEVIDNPEKEDLEQQLGSDESEMEDLKAEVSKLKQEKDEMYQRLLRTQAEFDNFKKRSRKEKEAERKYKAETLATELLPALDNFERALQVEVTDAAESFVDGVSMVYRQIKDALKANDVVEIESVGKEFDPNIHHAVMQVEEEDMESNIVTEELQKGYMLKDKVIRPAMVKVNK